MLGRFLHHDPWPLMASPWKPEPDEENAYLQPGDENDRMWIKHFGTGVLQFWSHLQWQCDECGSSIALDAPRYHCNDPDSNCDYDCCASCVGDNTHPHPLAQANVIAHTRLVYNCDGCGKKISLKEQRWHCALPLDKQPHDFDLCRSCHDSGRTAHACGLVEVNHPLSS